jgi:hypothetical protein
MRVLLLCFALMAAPATAEILLINGTLSGEPIPEGYKFELAVVGIREAAVVLEVVGKSCTGTPGLGPTSCQRATAIFSLPEGFSIANKKCYFKRGDTNLHIGNVTSLGQTHWIQLKRGALLEATLTAARLKLDTNVLTSALREDQFVELHPAR